MRHTMTGAITAGSILIEEGTHLPNSLLLQSESCSNGWASVKNARSTLEKEIQEAGWTFFFMAGEIRSTVFGFGQLSFSEKHQRCLVLGRNIESPLKRRGRLGQLLLKCVDSTQQYDRVRGTWRARDCLPQNLFSARAIPLSEFGGRQQGRRTEILGRQRQCPLQVLRGLAWFSQLQFRHRQHVELFRGGSRIAHQCPHAALRVRQG